MALGVMEPVDAETQARVLTDFDAKQSAPQDFGQPVAPGVAKSVLADFDKKQKEDGAKAVLNGGDDSAGTTFLGNALNTGLLNAPMALQAGLDYWRGKSPVNGFEPKTYKEALDNVNKIEDARSTLNPWASGTGTAAGIVGPIGATIMTGGAAAPAVAASGLKGVASRAGSSAVVGAGMGAVSEGFRTNDPEKMLAGAAFGGVAGAALSPLADVGGKLAGMAVDRIKGPVQAKISPEASAYLSEAYSGSVPAAVEARVLQKGGGEDAAREAVLNGLGISASKGQLSRDFKLQQLENNMAKSGDTFGPKANGIASDFYANQDAQIANAKEGVFGGMLGSQDAAERIMQSVRDAHAASKANYQKLYADAEKLPGAYDNSLFANMGTRIGTQIGDRPQSAVFLDPINTPKTIGLLKRLDDLKTFRPDANGEVPLSNVAGVRKMFTTLIGDSWNNPTDRRALQTALHQFDDHLTIAGQTGQFRGDPQALALLDQARAAFADHSARFKAQSGDGAGNIIQRIVDDRLPPMSASEFASKMAASGTKEATATTTRTNLADKIEAITNDLTPWKQAIWTQTVETGQPGRLADRISTLLSSDMGKKFSTTERANMKLVQKGLEAVSDNTIRGTSSNARPDTANALSSILHAGGSMLKNGGLGSVLGFAHGGLPGAVIGAGMNAGVNKIGSALQNRSYAKQAAHSFGAMPDYKAGRFYALPTAGYAGSQTGEETIRGLLR